MRQDLVERLVFTIDGHFRLVVEDIVPINECIPGLLLDLLINVFTVPLLMFTDTFPFCADTPAGNKTNATSKMVKFLKIRRFCLLFLKEKINFV